MSTIRQIIADKSTASAGSTIRQHFAAPAPGGGGTSTDPGADNVLAGIHYTINGVDYVGRRVFPVPPSNSGEFSLYAPLAAMKNLILGCQSWADACGGYANAQAQTFLVSAPAKSPLPHAIIDYGDAISSVRDAVEITRFNRSTSIMVYFAFAALSGDDETKNEQAFLTAINSIITFLEASQTYGGMAPVILAHELIDGPRRIEEHKRDKYGDIMEIAFSFKMEIPS